jgi:hypothetical protein
LPRPLSALEAVPIDTLASAATSRMVTRFIAVLLQPSRAGRRC